MNKKNLLISDFLLLTGTYISSKFSAGQKQRLAHFLALFSGSEILICDEGFCHIDSKLRQDIMSFYLNNKYYNSIVLVAHDAEFLLGFNVEEINIVK